ncbi:MAG: DNA polymerase Y family protein [Thermomicrobiales bacterium]|nr:DNA polymerase Y family protein [Thermomicrobiales bacterium]
MAIACILIPHFSLRMTLLDRPDLDGLPLVLTSPPNARTCVVDCSPEAAQRGVRPGMLLREVTALVPEAVFIEPNPVREATTFERILAALETVSPSVEPEGTSRCYVDISGLGRHYPSPQAAAQRLLDLIPSILRPRAGIAPGKFTALVAARQAKAGGVRFVSEEDVHTFLKTVPASWLPIELDVARRLERLGLITLGDLASLPATAMQARFGPQGRHIWNLASGIDDVTITSRPQQESVTEALDLPAPSSSREMLLIGLRQLVHKAFTRPELRYRHVRQARLQVLIEDHRSWEKEMTFGEPADHSRVIEILMHRLQALELPGAAERLILTLIGLVSEITKQERLPTFYARKPPSLVAATRQLKRRYGRSPLYHIVEVEPWSRIPERRHALISYDP